VYVSPDKSTAMSDELVKYGFSRVIFNPGAENPSLAQRLTASGVEVVEACTLVMLSTRNF
jgi:predicted CoA-binding protein